MKVFLLPLLLVTASLGLAQTQAGRTSIPVAPQPIPPAGALGAPRLLVEQIAFESLSPVLEARARKVLLFEVGDTISAADIHAANVYIKSQVDRSLEVTILESSAATAAGGVDNPAIRIRVGVLPPGAVSEVSPVALALAPPSTLPPIPAPRGSGPTRLQRGVTEGLRIKMVQPIYPSIARTAHQEGKVVLTAIIGKDGHVANLSIVSGPALLRQAAIDAVSQWQYKPYLLSGEPAEVITEITVHFDLN
ncbi:MAG: energy transducer TonB [Acidobacteriota bacterium]